MLKILVFAIIVTIIIIGGARYKKMDPAQQRKTLWRMATGMFFCVLLLLVITGKMHWIGAAIGALIPFVRNAFNLVTQVLPLWLAHRKPQQSEPNQQNGQAEPEPIAMAIQEALDILGLSGDLTKGEISESMVQDAHRRLIQKLHPDRGGNDYLAAKINQARDLLLAKIKQH